MALRQQRSKDQIEITRNQQVVHWKAVYIDSSFCLAEPQSINKLIELQKMIAYQKHKITSHPHNRMLKQQDSFQSHGQDHLKDHSFSQDGCKTQIDHALNAKKQAKLYKQLIEQEQRIRQNMIKMKSRRYYGEVDGQKAIQTKKKRRNLSMAKPGQIHNDKKQQNHPNLQQNNHRQNQQENKELAKLNDQQVLVYISKQVHEKSLQKDEHNEHKSLKKQHLQVKQKSQPKQQRLDKVDANRTIQESQKQRKSQNSIWQEYNQTQQIQKQKQQKIQEEHSGKNARVYSRDPSNKDSNALKQNEQMQKLNSKISFMEGKLKALQQKQNQIQQIRQSVLLSKKNESQLSAQQVIAKKVVHSNAHFENYPKQTNQSIEVSQVQKSNLVHFKNKKKLSIHRTIQQRSKPEIQSQVVVVKNEKQHIQLQTKDQKERMKEEIDNLNKTIRQLKLQMIKHQHPQYNQFINSREKVQNQIKSKSDAFEHQNYSRNGSPRLLDPNQSSQMPRPNFLIRKSMQKKEKQREESVTKQIIPITNQVKQNSSKKATGWVEVNSEVDRQNSKLQNNPNHPRFGKIMKNASPIKLKYNISGISSQQEAAKQKSAVKGQKVEQKPNIANSQARSKSRKSSQACSEQLSSCNDTSKSMAIKRNSIINPIKFSQKQQKTQKSKQPKSFKSEQLKVYQSQQKNGGFNKNQMHLMKTLDLQQERRQELKNNKIRIRQTPTGSDFKRKLNGLTNQQINAVDGQYPNSVAKTTNFNKNSNDSNSNRKASLDMKGIIVNQIPINKQKNRYSVVQRASEKIQEKPKIMFKKVAEFDKYSQSSVDQGRKIFVLQFQEKKRMDNQIIDSQPQQQQQIKALPQIKIKNIDCPQLPQASLANMAPKQQIEIAAQTFKLFKVKLNTKNPEQDIRMIKYKNCILFGCQGSPQKILWHHSGKFYIGGWSDSEQGNRTGEGYEYVPGKYVYKGQFSKGKRSGNGIAKYENGTVYQGQWLQGNRHGKGKFLDKKANYVFQGEWKDNKKDGFGTMRISQSEYYIGTFFKSVKSGHGIQVYSNGDKYKGQFVNGKYQGKGKYYWANGSSYNGQFISGFRQGHGKWRSAKKGGDCYIGQYKRDKKEGYGRYIWANGSCFQGSFKQDTKHGKGRMVFEDGRQIKGQWTNGQLIDIQGQQKMNPQSQAAYYPVRQKVKTDYQKNENQVFERPSKRLQSPGKIGKL